MVMHHLLVGGGMATGQQEIEHLSAGIDKRRVARE
jgi:hypothetical protein